MKFRTVVTSGVEVVFAGQSRAMAPVYCGAPPTTGLWRIDVPKFDDFLALELAPRSFGQSIEEYVFGFEIAELDEWGSWFKETRDYISYRPRNKSIVSVGQIEWKVVKDSESEVQLSHLGAALLASIERVGTMKRKPKDFDYAGLAQCVSWAIANCDSCAVSTDEI